MSDAICPVCGTDDVEYIGTNPDTGEDKYFCDECQREFVLNWDEIDEQNTNAYPDEYYNDAMDEYESEDDGEYEEKY